MLLNNDFTFKDVTLYCLLILYLHTLNRKALVFLKLWQVATTLQTVKSLNFSKTLMSELRISQNIFFPRKPSEIYIYMFSTGHVKEMRE